MAQMAQLMTFSHGNPHLPPSEALSQLVASFSDVEAQPQGLPALNYVPNMNPGLPQQPPGVRTPGMTGPPPFNSPAAAHLNLPGSPHVNAHTPSPAQNHIQAPGLAAQLSQQGTNSSQGTSANTSPNVTNKRRRASAVKIEGDDGGGPGGGIEVNGTSGPPGASKVKASPRVGGKRQKGHPG